jgi:hypothetical protein
MIWVIKNPENNKKDIDSDISPEDRRRFKMEGNNHQDRQASQPIDIFPVGAWLGERGAHSPSRTTNTESGPSAREYARLETPDENQRARLA